MSSFHRWRTLKMNKMEYLVRGFKMVVGTMVGSWGEIETEEEKCECEHSWGRIEYYECIKCGDMAVNDSSPLNIKPQGVAAY